MTRSERTVEIARGRRAIRRAAACEALEPRRMLSSVHEHGDEPDPIIPRNSQMWRDLHGPMPVQDTKPSAVGAGKNKPAPGPAALNSLVGTQPTGTLTGKVVYASGGHGFTWTNGTTWTTQRGVTNGMVEDMGNYDQLTYYADYILNAGGTMVPMRPIGHQLNQRIVDNAEAGFTIQSGAWSTSGGTPYWSNTGGSEAVHYQFANTALTETHVARWTPNLPAAGFYPVYAWWTNGTNRATDATYRINHAGGSYEVRVDQSRTGKGWVYLGTYYFASGSGGNVELSNKSATTGKVVIADAIRFGNGMGDWNSGGGISGRSREDEASLYWLYRSRGYSSAGTLVSETTVDGGFADEVDANVGAPIRWAAYMNDSTVGTMGDRIYLGFHSNAASGTARGTVGLISSSAPTPNQSTWATLTQQEIQNDMLGIGSPPLEAAWATRSPTLTGGYGEISNNTINGEFDATIIEVAFHDNATDANLMKDPDVRDWIARAEYQATVKYFDQFGGTDATMAPDVPTNVRAITDANGNVTIQWTAPAANATTGGAGTATGYRVFSSANGYGFALEANLGNVTSYQVVAPPTNQMTYYYVVATGPGGGSKPSFVVAAKPQTGRRAPILIVNNFDRMDRAGDKIETSSVGTYARVRSRYNNSHDYVVQAAESIENYNSALGVETATDAAVAAGQIVLTNYHTVIWMSGEQSAGDGTFTATTQPMLTTFLGGGGKLFVSGAEIGWDLVAQGNGASFYQNTLHTNYVSDDAATYTTSGGIAGSALAGLGGLSFDNGTNGTYDVDFADVISANGAGASAAMNYSTGGAAVVQYASGNTKILNMGFPFESIYTASQRNSLMTAALNYFGTNSTILSSTPGTPDLLPATDSGTSSTDNRTNFNNSSGGLALQFQVSGTVAGATVTIYNGATAIGSAVATGTTTIVTTNGTTTLTNGAKSITARQTESGKSESLASAALSVTIDTTAPAAPGASIVSSSSSSITLDWPNNAESDLGGYNVYRSGASGGPYTKLNGPLLSSSVYTDSTVSANTTYYYVVSAVDTAGNESANSAEASGTTQPTVSPAPTAVDLDSASDSGALVTDDLTNFNNSAPAKAPGFTVTGTIAGAMVTVYADGNAIGSAVASGTTTQIVADGATTLADGARSITARQTEPGKSESADSSGLSVTIDTAPFSAPAGLSAFANGPNIDVDWDTNFDPQFDYFTLFSAGGSGGPYTDISGPILESDYLDGPIPVATTVYYVVTVTDRAGNESALSAEVSATSAPLAPFNVTATTMSGYRIDLAWTLPNDTRDGIVVERFDGANWNLVATLADTATSYSVTALTPNTAYTHRVRAYVGTTYSLYGPVNATTFKLGDADGNGLVNIDDFFYTDQGYANGLSGWANGDFDDDGDVDTDDYTIIEAAFGS